MINTVRGPVPADQLGRTLMHEHFVFGYPGYQGDVTLGAFDREAALAQILPTAEALRGHGVQTVVDATPNECGRNPELLREISERSGLNIVCATGYYYEGEGGTPYFKFRATLTDIVPEIVAMMRTEITDGIAGTGIRAGVIKTGTSKDRITDYERAFLTAAAQVQRETGVPIITHTQEGTMGPEQARCLIDQGADPRRIMVGHMDGNTDPAYHRRTMDTGVSIAFDRVGLQHIVGMPSDEERVRVLTELIGDGYADRIMLSQDVVQVWLGRPLDIPEPVQQLLSTWVPTRIFDMLLPALREQGVSDEQIRTMLAANPQRLFNGG